MATTKALFDHLLDKFGSYSVEELIQLNNDTIQSSGWGSTKATFRTALISTLSRRGIDLSRIVSKDDGFTSIRSVAVKLENNTLVPIC